MSTKNILKTCELLYSSHNMPIICFDQKGKIIGYHCTYDEYATVFSNVVTRLMPNGPNPQLVNGYAGIYGVINVNDKLTIMTGPFVNKKITDELYDRIIHEHNLDWNNREQLKQFITSIPRFSYNRFLNHIALIHYLFNKEEINITRFFATSQGSFIDIIGEKHTGEILKESDFSHGTYYFEQQLLSYISAGDIEGLTAFFNRIIKAQPFTEGKLADDTLRQSKNIFIGLICMVGKVGAIRGNLDIEQTYQLIDLYTQECERCTTVNQINELRYNAIIDFTRRVAEQKYPSAYSKEVFSALQYIKTHTNQPIGVPDILEYVDRSRSGFMEQFKRETGETIGRYILKAKLQEAKLLLAYSDRSLVEISNFFYFSSQSHFQRAFKNEFGISPLAYRKKKNNS